MNAETGAGICVCVIVWVLFLSLTRPAHLCREYARILKVRLPDELAAPIAVRACALCERELVEAFMTRMKLCRV